MRSPSLLSVRYGVPLSALPIAVILSVFLLARQRIDFWSIVVQTVPLSVLFALSTAYTRFICRALPMGRGTLGNLAMVHLPAAAVTGGLWAGMTAVAGWAVEGISEGELIGIGETGELAVVFAVGMMTYLWAATACYLGSAVEDAIRAENRVVEAQCLALDAELKVLRAKLHPHFLFNSLNSIAALTAVDAERAREMCILLSDFLRHSLSFSSKREIKLSDELALVRAYLGVEQIRFSEKMTVREHIEAGTADTVVPPLLLQPLAENAVKHGIADMSADGWIDIDIRRVGDNLKICIQNAVDPDSPQSDGTGHGLAIVRERLRNVFGDRATLTIRQTREAPFVFSAEMVVPASEELVS